MKNYIQAGNSITITAAADISSGDIVKVGSLLGVACGDIANGATGEISLVGVYELTKKTTDDVSAGDKLYYDADNARLTLDAFGNTFMGIAIVAADGSATKVKILLNTLDVLVEKTSVELHITSIADTANYFIVAPFAGTITKVWSVIEGACQADTAVALELGGTLVTDSGLTITAADSGAGDVDSSTPTALNVVAAGDAIEVTCDGAGTTASPANITIEITKS